MLWSDSTSWFQPVSPVTRAQSLLSPLAMRGAFPCAAGDACRLQTMAARRVPGIRQMHTVIPHTAGQNAQQRSQQEGGRLTRPIAAPNRQVDEPLSGPSDKSRGDRAQPAYAS